MKFLWRVPVFLLIGALIPAFGQLSANLGAVSDYVWRGISQDEEDPALQGGVDYSANNGFYIGAWGSNVAKPLDVELDGYLGFAQELENGFGFDVGYIAYFYTGESDANFEEGYLGLSYKVFGVQYFYDFENENGYLDANLNFDLPNEFGLQVHFGQYEFDGGSDYQDYKVGLTKSWVGLDFELAYWDTDIDNSDIADSRVVLGVSKTWSFK